jgi:hypothetical protein
MRAVAADLEALWREVGGTVGVIVLDERGGVTLRTDALHRFCNGRLAGWPEADARLPESSRRQLAEEDVTTRREAPRLETCPGDAAQISHPFSDAVVPPNSPWQDCRASPAVP